MVIINVNRTQFNWTETLGEFVIFGKSKGYTVEDETRLQKVHGRTAIPEGTYQLGLRNSPKFSDTFYWSEKDKLLKPKNIATTLSGYVPHQLIHIENVPNFQYVLIHWGNTSLDTEGCLIIGKELGIVKNMQGVLKSKELYQEIYPELYSAIKKGDCQIQLGRKDFPVAV
jgi:hypothetical protein